MVPNADSDAPRSRLSAAILVIGASIYAIACLPAINARGYPPLDARWASVTYLWPAPIFLSAIFATFGTTSRRWQLIAFALFTAFIFQATTVWIVPRHITFTGTLLGTVFLMGPLHLAITFAIEKVCSFCLSRYRTTEVPISTRFRFPKVSLAAMMFGWTVLALTIASPFAFHSYVNLRARALGLAGADADWQAQEAVLFVESRHDTQLVNGYDVNWECDPKSGLRRKSRQSDSLFYDAYNKRIAELLAKYGTPSWSMSRYLVEPATLIALFNSNDLTEITEFPHDVTDSIVVFREGTIKRWGNTSSSHGPGLSIATLKSLYGGGAANMSVFVGEVNGIPEVVVIRNGNDWIGLFHQGGRLLMNASR